MKETFNQCKPLPKAHTMPWSSYDFGRDSRCCAGITGARNISYMWSRGAIFWLKYRDLLALRCVGWGANNLVVGSHDPEARFKAWVQMWGSSRALPAGRGGGARCAIPWEEGSVGRFGDPSPGRPLLLAWYALLRATPFLFSPWGPAGCVRARVLSVSRAPARRGVPEDAKRRCAS